VPVDPLFHNQAKNENSPAAISQPDSSLTCTDCGGPLEPGRLYRCLACLSAEWVALEERYGREWAARHRGCEV